MTPREALFMLGLKDNPSKEEINSSFKTRRMNALRDGDNQGAEIITRAWKIALAAEKDGAIESGKFITGEAGTTYNAKYDPSYVPPYEEPIVKNRIRNLPKYLLGKCQKTRQFFICEIYFELEDNTISVKNIIPQYSNEAVRFHDMELPVMNSDLEIIETIEDYSDSISHKHTQYYINKFGNDSTFLMEMRYGQPTRLGRFEPRYIRSEKGLEYLCCPYCGSEDINTCSKCNSAHCGNEYLKIDDKFPKCPFCDHQHVPQPSTPQFYGKSSMYINGRKQQQSIEHKKRNTIERKPKQRLLSFWNRDR